VARQPVRTRYLVGAAVLCVVYLAAAVLLWTTKDFDGRGPLSPRQPDLREPWRAACR
jgi:hypothetical protein